VTPRQIAVAVVVHHGKVLVGRRADDAAELPGCAEFPGGKIEPHESATEAAVRECLEETGVAVRVIDGLPAVAVPQSLPPLTIFFHWASPIDPSAQPRPPFDWVPIANLSSRRFPDANATVLAILQRDHGSAHGGS